MPPLRLATALRVAPWLALAAAACGTAAARTKARPAPAAYEVHEWGLMRAAPGDVLDLGAVAPVERVPVITVDKPVLYFHAKDALRLKSVTVTAVGGAVIEHWPVVTKPGLPTQVTWRDLSLTPGVIADGATCAATFPLPTQRPCSDLPRGLECEAPGLGHVIAASASCLTSGAQRLPFLFYRSQSKTFTPPLELRTLASGEVRVTNTGTHAIPGQLIRMRRLGGQVVTLAVAPPLPGASITLGDDFAAAVVDSEADGKVATDELRPRLPGSVVPGQQALMGTLALLGLDREESAAFLRAWEPSLFGGNHVPLGPGSDDKRPAPMIQEDSILYFIPEASLDGLARLEFDPAPTAVRRAIAMWQRIAP